MLLDDLKQATFLKRYKRFFADVELDGEVSVAHVPNTGSLKTCLYPNSACRVSVSKDPKRKLKFTLQMVKTPSSWVGVNTALSNKLVGEAWAKASVPHWFEYLGAQAEVKINDQSRIDWVMWKPQTGLSAEQKISLADFKHHQFHFVEVKNVSLCENGQARFPDAVTTRGQKHLQELMALVERGQSCEIFFTIQRQDVQSFAPADDIDPEYGRLLRLAQQRGVKISAYACHLSDSEIVLDTKNPLPIKL